MPTFNASNARCRVFTFKEGLLSAVAHDLEIDVTDFTIEVADDGSITGRFDPRSLRVLHAVVNGRPDAGAVSDKDKRKIQSNIEGEVLETKRHGSIEFSSSAVDEREVRGTLTLHGRSRDIVVPIREDGDDRVARVRLHQPDFGIKPYSAMLGTLKIQADVEVELRLPK